MENKTKALKAEIDGRLQAEESLRESEERFRTMFAATATGIATSTPQGSFLQANAAYCRISSAGNDRDSRVNISRTPTTPRPIFSGIAR